MSEFSLAELLDSRARRGARALGADDQPAVHARAEDDRLRSRLGARRGRVPLRRRRQPLPRPARRVRDVQRRPEQPARPRRARRGARARDCPARCSSASRRCRALLAEELLRRTPARLERVLFTSSGTEAVEAALKLGRAATGRDARRLGRARLPRAHARLALGERRPGVRRALRAAAARASRGFRSATWTRSSASCAARTSRSSSSSRCRARA